MPWRKPGLRLMGKPNRRIADLLATKPFAFGRGVVEFDSSRTPSVPSIQFNTADFNASVAAAVLRGRTPVVFVDEITEYLTDKGACLEALTRTPRPMPCFDEVWIEGCPWVPGETQRNHFTSVGGLVRVAHLHRDPAALAVVKDALAFHNVQAANEDSEPYVAVSMFVYATGVHGECYGPLARATYVLNASYEILRSSVGREKGDPALIVTLTNVPQPYEAVPRLLDMTCVMALSAAARTFGLLNCSNVKMVEEGRTNDHLSANRRAKDNLAWLKYHVLKVKVGTQLVPVQPRAADATGRGVALHTVRGHFKNYSDKGLFGKYRGSAYSMIWCPPHVRGDTEHGVVVRDYALETPRAIKDSLATDTGL